MRTCVPFYYAILLTTPTFFISVKNSTYRTEKHSPQSASTKLLPVITTCSGVVSQTVFLKLGCFLKTRLSFWRPFVGHAPDLHGTRQFHICIGYQNNEMVLITFRLSEVGISPAVLQSISFWIRPSAKRLDHTLWIARGQELDFSTGANIVVDCVPHPTVTAVNKLLTNSLCTDKNRPPTGRWAWSNSMDQRKDGGMNFFYIFLSIMTINCARKTNILILICCFEQNMFFFLQ